MQQEIIETADKLHDVQDILREYQKEEQDLKAQLAGLLKVAGIEQVTGSLGQRYAISYGRATYTFNLPVEEFERLGIKERCTPPAPGPKLTKAQLDKMLKTGDVTDADVAVWQAVGWYQVERSGELTIRQLESKAEDLAPQF